MKACPVSRHPTWHVALASAGPELEDETWGELR